MCSTSHSLIGPSTSPLIDLLQSFMVSEVFREWCSALPDIGLGHLLLGSATPVTINTIPCMLGYYSHPTTLEVSPCWHFPSLHQCSSLSRLRLTQASIWLHTPFSVSHYPFRLSTSPGFGLLPIAHVVNKYNVLGFCSPRSHTATFMDGFCHANHLATVWW